MLCQTVLDLPERRGVGRQSLGEGPRIQPLTRQVRGTGGEVPKGRGKDDGVHSTRPRSLSRAPPAWHSARMSLTTRVLLGLIVGLVIGAWLAPAESGVAATVVAWAEPIGALWVNAIRMTVIPLLVSLLLTGILSSGTGTVARVGGKGVAWFIGLAGFSAALGGIAAPRLLRLFGTDGVRLPEVRGGAVDTAEISLPPFRDWFVDLLPSNPVAAAADGAILPLVLFTVIFGLAATRVGEQQRTLIRDVADAVGKTMFVIVGWILAVAPVGVFALTLTLAARTGGSLLGAVAGFLATTAILVTAATLALYPLVGVFGDVGLGRFARACAPAQAVGFSTRSSLASLPVMMEEAEHTLRLPDHVTGLVLPASVSLFKYASPVVRIAGTFFVASLYGVDLGLTETVTLVASLGALSFYSPGIPSGGLFVMAPIYQAFGLPLEGIGILIALDIIPDMFITTGNVTADMAVATIVAGSTVPEGAAGTVPEGAAGTGPGAAAGAADTPAAEGPMG